MTIWRYLLHGVPIASEIELPESEHILNALVPSPTLRILAEPATGSITPELPSDVRTVFCVPVGKKIITIGGVDASGRWMLRWSGVLEVRLDPMATTMIARPDPDADPAFLPILLGASALAFALTVRQHLVLHASCVAINGAAVAVVADSGGGKSTLSALLCAAGASFVSDDVLRVDLTPDPVIHRGSREMRLRLGSAEVAELLARFPQRTTADERMAVRVDSTNEATLPLRRIVLPVLHPTLEAAYSEPVPPTEALFLLLSKLRVPGVLDGKFHESQFTQLADLVGRVEVVRLHLPWTRPFTAEIAATYVEAITRV